MQANGRMIHEYNWPSWNLTVNVKVAIHHSLVALCVLDGERGRGWIASRAVQHLQSQRCALCITSLAEQIQCCTGHGYVPTSASPCQLVIVFLYCLTWETGIQAFWTSWRCAHQAVTPQKAFPQWNLPVCDKSIRAFWYSPLSYHHKHPLSLHFLLPQFEHQHPETFFSLWLQLPTPSSDA